MIRTSVLAVLRRRPCADGCGRAVATGPPESEDGRFTFHRADDGYLRLDGRTGQVSLCNRRPAGWLCQAVPDDRLALEAEIARLQGENALLKKELLSRNLPLPNNVRPERAGQTGRPAAASEAMPSSTG